MIIEDFKKIVDIILYELGVYWFFDELGIILYVGKVKSLCNWVVFYFGEWKGWVYKIWVLVKNVDYLEFILVEIEVDVLLLENFLIKKY